MSRRPRNNSSSSPGPAVSTRYGVLSPATRAGRASLQECHPDKLGAAIDAVIDSSDMISFSRTSDGGAVLVYVKSESETVKVYCVEQSALDEVVEQLAGLPES